MSHSKSNTKDVAAPHGGQGPAPIHDTDRGKLKSERTSDLTLSEISVGVLDCSVRLRLT